jgi:DNA-directed RNA polymerases I, II, and III subunit RPABC1
MASENLRKAIGVHKQGLTPSASKHLRDTNGTYNIDMFNEKELVINVTKHVLVPRHEPLSQSDKDAVMKQ